MRSLNWRDHIGGYQDEDAAHGQGDYSFGDFTDSEIEQMERDRKRDQEGAKQRSETNQKIEDLEKRLAASEKAKAAKAPPAAKPQPKPKGDMQIDPVQHSPEISGAQKVLNDYQSGLQNKKSPWEQATANAESSTGFDQNDTNFTSQFQPSGGSDLPDGMERKDPQQFADKYKLDLIKSGATNNGFS